MKILWIYNHVPKSISSQMNTSKPLSGTWLEQMQETFANNTDFELTIFCFSTNPLHYNTIISVDGISYHVFPVSKKEMSFGLSKKNSLLFKSSIKEIHPDIMVFHGTEFPIALSLKKEDFDFPICFNIQGLISVISDKYFYADFNFSIFNFKLSIPFVLQKRRDNKRSQYEKRILTDFDYFIGRTNWDRANIKLANPNVKYYYETQEINPLFLKYKFDLEKFEKHTIFCAGGYRRSLKGAHRVVLAAKTLVNKYPDLKIILPGSGKEKFGYQYGLIKKIKKFGLFNNVFFAGSLAPEEMAHYFSNSNCYVLASSIENIPNTMIEAMTVGIPTIVSHVGGVMDMCIHEENALVYRFDELAELIDCISRVFDSSELRRKLSQNAIKYTREKYCYGKNEEIENIYKCIISDFQSSKRKS